LAILHVYSDSRTYETEWDISNTFIEAVTGEILDIRHIWPVDAWVPVIGINAHGSPDAQIEEINLILTDIGGDPYGPPGNGGFNPNYALNEITTSSGGECSIAVQNDFSFTVHGYGTTLMTQRRVMVSLIFLYLLTLQEAVMELLFWIVQCIQRQRTRVG
jgi:hypothetical protein